MMQEDNNKESPLSSVTEMEKGENQIRRTLGETRISQGGSSPHCDPHCITMACLKRDNFPVNFWKLSKRTNSLVLINKHVHVFIVHILDNCTYCTCQNTHKLLKSIRNSNLIKKLIVQRTLI